MTCRALLVPTLALLLPALGGCGGGFLGDGGETGDGPNDGTEYNDHCAAQADWDPDWEAFENDVVVLVNQNRAAGAVCGSDSYGSAGPVVVDAQLRCAARLHSQDMFERNFFDHTNPDGQSPWDRVDETDYDANAVGENIAQGYPDPAAVMDGWMNSPGHCANIMAPNTNEIGVGFYGEDNYWTQVMGRRD